MDKIKITDNDILAASQILGREPTVEEVKLLKNRFRHCETLSYFFEKVRIILNDLGLKYLENEMFQTPTGIYFVDFIIRGKNCIIQIYGSEKSPKSKIGRERKLKAEEFSRHNYRQCILYREDFRTGLYVKKLKAI